MIAFLTDWSVKSYYVGVAKAVIKRINPGAEIIDITHEINPFDVRMACHVLLRASKDFPKGTIFLAVVDHGVGTVRKPICMVTKNEHLYIGPDNGLFTLVAHEYGVKQIRELNNKMFHYGSSATFHGRDIFASVAAHLSKGVSIQEIGSVLPNYNILPFKSAQMEENSLIGEIAFFDAFGNAQTNIPNTLAQELNWEMDDMIQFGKVDLPYVRTYGDVEKGTPLIHPDSSGYLEIAVNQGSAREILHMEQGQEITLRRK